MEPEHVFAMGIDAQGVDDSFRGRATEARPLDLHTAGFYEADSDLEECLGHTVATSIISAESVLVIASGARLSALSARLAAVGPDLAQATRSGRVVFVEAESIVERASADGSPDTDRLLRDFVHLLERTVQAGLPAAVFQEVTSILWNSGARQAALDLDARLGAVAARAGVALTCTYPMSIFDADEHRPRVQELCMGHAHVLPIKPRRCMPRAR